MSSRALKIIGWVFLGVTIVGVVVLAGGGWLTFIGILKEPTLRHYGLWPLALVSATAPVGYIFLRLSTSKRLQGNLDQS